MHSTITVIPLNYHPYCTSRLSLPLLLAICMPHLLQWCMRCCSVPRVGGVCQGRAEVWIRPVDWLPELSSCENPEFIGHSGRCWTARKLKATSQRQLILATATTRRRHRRLTLELAFWSQLFPNFPRCTPASTACYITAAVGRLSCAAFLPSVTAKVHPR